MLIGAFSINLAKAQRIAKYAKVLNNAVLIRLPCVLCASARFIVLREHVSQRR